MFTAHAQQPPPALHRPNNLPQPPTSASTSQSNSSAAGPMNIGGASPGAAAQGPYGRLPPPNSSAAPGNGSSAAAVAAAAHAAQAAAQQAAQQQIGNQAGAVSSHRYLDDFPALGAAPLPSGSLGPFHQLPPPPPSSSQQQQQQQLGGAGSAAAAADLANAAAGARSNLGPGPAPELVTQTPAQQIIASPADRFGLLGLLSVIRMQDPDLSMLALGSDLQNLGLNMGSQV
ncbi:unnamed protein product [Tilletia controversa]|nr:unnamed protein product [Tilletia controversa]